MRTRAPTNNSCIAITKPHITRGASRESQLGLLADHICREGGVLQQSTGCITRSASRAAKPLSTDHLTAIAWRTFSVWYGGCDRPCIAGRLGGAHHKEKR